MTPKLIPFLCLCGLAVFFGRAAAADFESDIIETSKGPLEITFIGHGTLMFSFESLVMHVDPVSAYGDYSLLPKADIILITHQHGDHLDPDAVQKILKKDTEIILTESCRSQFPDGRVVRNGEKILLKGIPLEAVPAYNVLNKRSSGDVFHPRGEGNGYVLDFGDKRVYIAGDTENIPEMKQLKDIEVAFLPMNLPYTMSPEMAAAAARSFLPRILYPYHYGQTDPQKLVDLLADVAGIEVRVRKLR